MEARLMVLEHLKIIEHDLGMLKGGIEVAFTLPPSGVIIHKEHTLETIQHMAISVWVCKDLLEHEDSDTEKEKNDDY